MNSFKTHINIFHIYYSWISYPRDKNDVFLQLFRSQHYPTQSNYNPLDFLILTLKVIIQHCPNKINNDSPKFSILTLEVNRALSLPTYLVDIFVIEGHFCMKWESEEIFWWSLRDCIFLFNIWILTCSVIWDILLHQTSKLEIYWTTKILKNIQETGEGTNPSPFLSLSIMLCLDALIYGPCKYISHLFLVKFFSSCEECCFPATHQYT